MGLVTSKIKDIIYKVAPSGKLVAILVLQSKEELVDEDVLKNAILLDNALLIHSKGYHIGSKVQIDTEDLGNPIRKVLHASHPIPISIKCPSCGEKLSQHFKDKKLDYIECTNAFCTGQSQSHLFRLISYHFVGTDIHIIRKFLNEFVTESGTTDIRNITDFDKIYIPVKGRNTRTRLNNWIKFHGNNMGEKLFEIDVAVENLLSEHKLPKRLFWLVANLPVDEETFNIIEKINPKMFLAGRDDNFKILTHNQQNYLVDNMDFILKLINIFQSYGKKEWI